MVVAGKRKRWYVLLHMRSTILLAGCFLILGLACNGKTGVEDDGAGTDSASGGLDTTETTATTTTPSDGSAEGSATGSDDGNEATDTGAATGDEDTGPGDSTGDESTGSADGGLPQPCQITACQGKVYECGDCVDNDGDGLIDMADPNCWGPCDNNEAGWKGEIPGQNAAPCKMDCYFDGDSGAGNDDCYWSHACDPLEPSPKKCEYNPNANIPGTSMDCAEASAMQSDMCDDFCGPLTPNGCDCFGCCEVHVGNETHVVYLGTEDDGGNGTCNLANVADPDLCAPCTVVPGCFNPCTPEDCEVCIGQAELPEGCEEAKCPAGLQPCNPALGSADCPEQQACITGCCTPEPQ
jgi:hypothetical protein